VKKNLVLLGMMGVGKTTLGNIVAKYKNMEFFDTDLAIEKKNLMSINEMFEKKGEAFFRKEEEQIVLDCLKKENCVISLGGGAFINKIIRENVLKNSISFWLDVKAETLNNRIKRNKKRPLLKEENNKKKIFQLFKDRKHIYKLAHHKINCDKMNKDSIVKKIIEIYEKY
tara:strand:+ start:193 stop:702 length:510 start_codon:yes stop_codon:yes gene_type:complete